MNRVYPTTWARVLHHTVLDAVTGCWLWTAQIRNRYPVMSMRIDGKHQKVDVHRWVAQQVLGRELHPWEETIEHVCTHTLCICPNCIGLMTNEDNAYSARMRQLGEECDRPITMIVPPGYRYHHPDEPIPF